MTAKKKPAPKAASQKPKPAETTVITMVVDESGSMTHLFDATVAGFNEYVSKLQHDTKGHTYFSAITFDTMGIRKLQVGAPLAEAVKLGPDNYRPNAGTPLLDAVGKAIAATDEVMKLRAGDKAIVVIQTDGHENASHEYTLASLKIAIEARQSKGWHFVFIGAGIDAFADAAKFGISGVNTMSYSPDAAGTRATFAAAASNSGGIISGLRSNMAFTAQQSKLSGEDAKITAAKMASVPPANSIDSTLDLTE